MADLKISFTLEDFPEEYLEECYESIREHIDQLADDHGCAASYLIVEEF